MLKIDKLIEYSKRHGERIAEEVGVPHLAEDIAEECLTEVIARFSAGDCDIVSAKTQGIYHAYMFARKQAKWHTHREPLQEFVAAPQKKLHLHEYCATRLAAVLSQMARHEFCIDDGIERNSATRYAIYRDAVIDGIMKSNWLSSRWGLSEISAALIHEELRNVLVCLFSEGYIKWSKVLCAQEGAADIFCFYLGNLPYVSLFYTNAVQYEEFDACLALDKRVYHPRYVLFKSYCDMLKDRETLGHIRKQQAVIYGKRKRTDELKKSKKKLELRRNIADKANKTTWAKEGTALYGIVCESGMEIAAAYIYESKLIAKDEKDLYRLTTLRTARAHRGDIPQAWLHEFVESKFHIAANVVVLLLLFGLPWLAV